MYRTIPVALIVLVACVPSTYAQLLRGLTPTFLRLSIVDTSSSMDKERINVVQTELRSLLRQLPPSPEHPFALVTFASTASQARVFTDLKSAEQAIAGLNGSGGTSIAAGLHQGYLEAKRHRSIPNIWVLLYTDGEDGDQAAILREEALLDGLFASRKQQGLGQTVVFCKRWQGANLDLKQAFEKHGHAKVHDAGELSLQPITIEPQFKVLSNRWSTDEPGQLEVDAEVRIDVRGKGHAALPPLRVRNLNQGSSGDTDVEITPGTTPPKQIRLRVPVSQQALAQGKFSLDFDVAPPQPKAVNGALQLPVLTAPRYRLPVTLPFENIRNIVTATLEQTGVGTWTDPIQRKVSYSVKLTLNVKAADNTKRDRSSEYRVFADAGNTVIQGDTRFRLPGLGNYTVPMTIDVPPRTRAANKSPYTVGLTLQPVNVPAYLTFVPAKLHVSLTNLPVPAPLTTSIHASVRSLTKPSWTDIGKGLASFQVETFFRVDGPIAPNTKITLVASPAVPAFDFTPKTLHAGTQTVKFSITARLNAAPHRTRLPFHLVPPKPTAAIRFEAKRPLDIIVTGPEPLQLLLTDGRRPLSMLEATVRDDVHSVDFELQPVLRGLEQPGIARGLSARLQPQSNAIRFGAHQLLPLYKASRVHAAFPKNQARSFFRNTRLKANVEVLPTVNNPAIQGSRYESHITFEAPFKRLAILVSISLSLLLTIVVLVRLFCRLQQTES